MNESPDQENYIDIRLNQEQLRSGMDSFFNWLLEYRLYNVLILGTSPGANLPNICSPRCFVLPCALAWAYFFFVMLT